MPVYGIYRMILEVVGHDQTGGIFQRISSGFASVMQYATAIIGAMVFERIASGIGTMVTQSIEAVAWMQQLDLGLSSLVAREMVQTGAANSVAEAWQNASNKADILSDKLQEIAILSPYTVESVSQTYKMAMAFGFTTDQAMLFTQALLENAAGIGASNDMLDRMAYNLAQIRLQGKVTALDIRQLALAGFDLNTVLKYVGDQMGVNIKTHLDFNEAIKSGKITWEDFTKYFAQYADENFGGASERMARSLMGLKSTFHDVFVLTMPRILGPAAESITASLNKILDWFIKFRETGQLEVWAANIKTWVDEVIRAIEYLFVKIVPLETRWVEFIHAVFQIPKDRATEIVETAASIWNAITTVWGVGVKIVSGVVENLKEVFSGLQVFWVAYGPGITDAVGSVISALGAEALGGKPTWIDIIFSPLKQFVTWLIANGPEIVNIFGSIAKFLTKTFFPALTKVFTFLSDNWKTIVLFFAAFKIGVSIFTKVSAAIKVVSVVIAALTSPIALIAGLIGLLAVAWINNWGGIQQKILAVWTVLQPIFQSIATWFQINLPIAIAWLTNAWNTLLLPAFQRVWTWLSTVMIPWIAGVLIPWFQTNIPLAIQTVSNFWTGVLLPAILTVWNFLTTWVIPVFTTVANVLSTVVGGALQVVSAIWTGLVLPAIQAVWSFIQTYLMPIWVQVADVISSLVGNAVAIISNMFTSVLLPAIQGAWDIINNYLIPVWKEVYNIIVILIGIIGTVFSAVWEKYLAPAVGKVYTQFAKYILPILTTIRDFVVDKIGPAVMWFHKEVIGPFVEALQGGLREALEWFRDILLKIKEFLSNFELPPWLRLGSPTPFEVGLRGINAQLDLMVAKRLPNINAMFNRLPSFNGVGELGIGGGSLTVEVNVASISSEIDVDRMAYKIARAIQRNRG